MSLVLYTNPVLQDYYAFTDVGKGMKASSCPTRRMGQNEMKQYYYAKGRYGII